MMDTIAAATEGRGIYVVDRGGDRSKLYLPMLARGLRFIVRLIGNRHLRVRGHLRSARDLARGTPLRYAETVVREVSGGEKKLHLQYGFRAVTRPGQPATPLTLVVVQGLGAEPMLLLTNLEVKAARASVWRVVRGYLTRWLVEETIRFIKQSYQLEDGRGLNYERLRNLAALVMASAYFGAAWPGQSLKLAALASRVLKVARRFFGVPEFHYYALAGGIAFLLSRLRLCRPKPPAPMLTPQLSLFRFT
jgi:Transposase DDE domain